ncbi:hypothetical protein INR49_022911 [Caranx melampygus]|nr:hypothetical protein INR49_022911 [Caranx melampygus]
MKSVSHSQPLSGAVVHTCPTGVKMLQALGLKSTLITDGSSPINLFTTANGLLGALPGQSQGQ